MHSPCITLVCYMTQTLLPPKPTLRAPAPFAEESQSRPWHYVLLAVLLIILAALLIYPICLILIAAVTKSAPIASINAATTQVAATQPLKTHTILTLDWLQKAFTTDVVRTKLLNSLALGLVVTLLCNLISFPLALLSHRYTFPGKTLLSALVLVPLVLPPFVGAIGMRQLFGSFGAFTVLLQHLQLMGPHQGFNWLLHGGFWMLALLISLSLYPITYLNLQAALANIDPAMLEAAENLGGSRVGNFFKITLPLAMPGIFAGSALTFIWAFTELGTPLLLNYPFVISRSIFDELGANPSSSYGYAQVLIVLAVSVSVYLVGKRTLGRSAYAMTSKAAVAATTVTPGPIGSLLCICTFALIILLAVLPHLSVIAYSFTALAFEKTWVSLGGIEGETGWYRTMIPTRLTLTGYATVFTDPQMYRSIFNSIKYAGVSTLIDCVLGIAIAWVLIRTRVWGRALLDAFSMLPLAVPGLVMAFGYQALLGVPPYIPGIGYLWDGSPKALAVMNPFLILVIAYSMRRLPYLVRSTAGGLQQTSVTLEEAALNLGASPLRTLLQITLPLILANLIAGALLTFSFAMLEVSDSIVLAHSDASFPIAKALYALGNDSAAAASIRNACCLGSISMLLLIVTITAATAILGKRLGVIFRA